MCKSRLTMAGEECYAVGLQRSAKFKTPSDTYRSRTTPQSATVSSPVHQENLVGFTMTSDKGPGEGRKEEGEDEGDVEEDGDEEGEEEEEVEEEEEEEDEKDEKDEDEDTESEEESAEVSEEDGESMDSSLSPEEGESAESNESSGIDDDNDDDEGEYLGEEKPVTSRHISSTRIKTEQINYTTASSISTVGSSLMKNKMLKDVISGNGSRSRRSATIPDDELLTNSDLLTTSTQSAGAPPEERKESQVIGGYTVAMTQYGEPQHSKEPPREDHQQHGTGIRPHKSFKNKLHNILNTTFLVFKGER